MRPDMISAGKFSTSQAVRFGTQTLMDNFGFFIFVSLLVGLVSRIPSLARPYVHPDGAFLLDVGDFILGSAVAAGLIRVALNFSRHGKATITDFLSSFPSIVRFVWASFLYGSRALLLWVPGIAFLFVVLPFILRFRTLQLAVSWSSIFVDIVVAAIVCRFVWTAALRGATTAMLWWVLGAGVVVSYLIVPLLVRAPLHPLNLAVPWPGIVAGAIGAAALAVVGTVAVRVIIRGGTLLVEQQFFGHAMFDERLGVGHSFERSSAIARPARRDLFLFDLLFLGAGAIVAILQTGAALIPGGQHASDTVWSFLKEFVLLAGWLIMWPFVLAQAFIYRTLAAQLPAASPPASP